LVLTVFCFVGEADSPARRATRLSAVTLAVPLRGACQMFRIALRMRRLASPDFSLNKSTARYVVLKDPTGSRRILSAGGAGRCRQSVEKVSLNSKASGGVRWWQVLTEGESVPTAVCCCCGK